MCTVKSPTVKKNTDATKDVAFMRNSYFDGLGPAQAARMGGTRSFRINPGTPRRSTTVTSGTQTGTGSTNTAGTTGTGTVPYAPVDIGGYTYGGYGNTARIV